MIEVDVPLSSVNGTLLATTVTHGSDHTTLLTSSGAFPTLRITIVVSYEAPTQRLTPTISRVTTSRSG